MTTGKLGKTQPATSLAQRIKRPKKYQTTIRYRMSSLFVDLFNLLSGIFTTFGIHLISCLVKRPFLRPLFSGFHLQKLVVAPVDLNLADPGLAHEFYHGRFALEGRVVRTGATSPWMVEAPQPAWESALHDFSWLRHMHAAKTAIATAHARILVEEWISLSAKNVPHLAWTQQVTAQRIISWISHANMLLKGASHDFPYIFFKMLHINIRYLRLTRPLMEKNQQGRLETHIALCFVAITFAAPLKQRRTAERRLINEFEAHILPDGGHISRNPAALVPILTNLISLCHCYQQAGLQVPEHFIKFVEKIDMALRFFQHRDQSLANFNGVGPLLPERLTRLLNIHATLASPPAQAPYSGYQRLSCGTTTVIADTGCPPEGNLSATAGAGCLSFEMSSGTHRFIVNCGLDPHGDDEFRFFGRLTASHSTATLNDTSSCRFRHGGRVESVITQGPENVRLKHMEQPDSIGFIACHDGYTCNFNRLHQRSIALSKDGNLLQGADRFISTTPERNNDKIPDEILATVRFHLHPDVEVSQLDDRTLRLEVMRADVWTLTCQADMYLEDSIYFCGLKGPLRTRQIFFSFDAGCGEEIYWAFTRQTRTLPPKG